MVRLVSVVAGSLEIRGQFSPSDRLPCHEVIVAVAR